MRRADRLFQIVQHLRGGRLVTAHHLATRLDVSQRTVYRDIADLRRSGVPIEGEAGLGYVMRAGFELPPLMLTRDEVIALVAGARLLAAFGGPDMASSAEEAVVKISAVLPETERKKTQAIPIHAVSPSSADATRVRLDQIAAAIEAQRTLQLDYQDGSGTRTHRTVRPLGLTFWGEVWTLVAWCELRQAARLFRVDRIGTMSLGGTFTAEPTQTLQAVLSTVRKEA